MSFCTTADYDMKVKLTLFITYQRRCARVSLLISSFSIFIGHKAAADRTGKETCKGFEKTSGQFSVYFCNIIHYRIAHYSYHQCKSWCKHSKTLLSRQPYNRLVYLNGIKCCKREGGFKECQCRAGLFQHRTQDCW